MPREELPEKYQPHRSFYGKISCFVNGIDPYPADHERRRNNTLPIQRPINKENYSLSQVLPSRPQAQTVVHSAKKSNLNSLIEDPAANNILPEIKIHGEEGKSENQENLNQVTI